MNIQKLRYYVDIVECGSISAAARKNYIAQQSMSACLRELEELYGLRLLERSTPLRPTAEGQRFYATARQILSLLRQFDDSLREEAAPLVIGLSYGSAPPVLADIIDLANARRDVPLEIRFEPNCADRSPLPDAIELFWGMSPPENCKKIPLLEDRLVVAVSETLLNKSFPSDRRPSPHTYDSPLPLETFKPLPFAVLTPDSRSSSFPDGFRIVSRSNSGEIAMQMCLNRKCAILIAQDYAERAFSTTDDILLFPVQSTSPDLILYIYYRKNRKLSQSAKDFIAAAKWVFSHGRERG